MAEVILLDTSIIIDFYRKKNKAKSALFQLINTDRVFAISAITHYELFVGAKTADIAYWHALLSEFVLLPFDADISMAACEIDRMLKKKRKRIAIPDLFIAATAVKYTIPLATLNKKHFIHIDNLLLTE